MQFELGMQGELVADAYRSGYFCLCGKVTTRCFIREVQNLFCEPVVEIRVATRLNCEGNA